jgi:RNA polymerase sigma factor (sigma-70 family)
MATQPLQTILRFIRKWTRPPTDGEATDRELLHRFVRSGEGEAFAVLLRRHGPMVLGVCRRLLGAHDAEDAFQATFLVLVRRAAALSWQESIGSWLYEVACRVALKARARSARAREHERRAGLMRETIMEAAPGWDDLRPFLDAELRSLPEKYRRPVVLCYLEGHTNEEAARMLGWPAGTVKGRLARARELLRRRLSRRGVSVPSAALAALVAENATAALPNALAEGTLRAALLTASGHAACGFSTTAIALAEGVLNPMALTKSKLVLVTLLVLGMAGAGVLLSRTPAGPVAEQTASRPAPDGKPIEKVPEMRKDRHGDPLPPFALARMGTTRLRHEGAVHCVAVSPDGKIIASGSDWPDVCARLWDAETGQELHRLNLDGRVFAVAFSPDGRTVASGSEDRTVRLWDVKTGKETARLEGHEAAVSAVAFTPDGKLLTSVGPDGSVRVWEVSTGKATGRLKVGNSPFLGMALSPDGKWLATAVPSLQGPGKGEDAVVVWSLKTGAEAARFSSPRPAKDFTFFGGVAFSQDGKLLAAGGWDDGIRIYDAATWKEVRRLKKQVDGGGLGFCSVAFSPDGKLLASGDPFNRVGVWDVATGEKRWGAEGDPSYVPAFHVYSPLSAVAFTPDGKGLVTGSDDCTVRLWDAAGPRERTFGGHRWSISSVAFSPNGKTLASAGWDLGIRVWDSPTGHELASLKGHAGPTGQPPIFLRLAFRPDGRTLISAALDGTVRFWDPGAGKEICSVERDRPGSQPFVLSADGRWFAAGGFAGGAWSVRVWDVDGGKEVHRFATPGELDVLAFGADGKALAGACRDRRVRVWDLTAGKESRTLSGPTNVIHALAFSPDGKQLAAAGGNRTSGERPDLSIWRWDLTTGKVLPRLPGHEGGPVRALAFSPDGKVLASGGTNRTIRIWELATRGQRCQLPGHLGAVLTLAFSPDGKALASGSADATVLVWDVTGQNPAGPAGKPAAKELETWWDDLAAPDAALAHRRMGALLDAPTPALAHFKERLRPVEAVAPERIARWIADLDSDQFAVRREAMEKLEALDTLAEAALRAALKGNPPLEGRKRMEELLRKAEGPWSESPEGLRSLRALEVLEHFGTPAARELLASLAKGAPEARLTREAKACLQRLQRWDAPDER